MNTHIISFHGEMKKKKNPLIIIKYPPYRFFCQTLLLCHDCIGKQEEQAELPSGGVVIN